ncbi:MAG: hypothetical protein HUU54_03780 [Ignavibacteriaceae bacterium]|nr:hypothetical protein [Ignavibacteriaceae bacterium]
MAKEVKEILNRLTEFGRREVIRDLLVITQYLTIAFVSLLLLVIFSEWLFNFSSSVRTVVFFGCIISAVAAFSFYVLIPAARKHFSFRRTGYYEAAGKIGSIFPEIKDDLINSLQLINKNENTVYSPVLINAQFASVYEKVKGINFSKGISFDLPKKIARYTVGILLLFSALFLFSGFSSAAYRLINFSSDFTPPPKYTFIILPGNVNISKGEDVLVRIKVNESLPKSITFYSKNVTQSVPETRTLYPDSLGLYSVKMMSVLNTTEYFASAEKVESKKYKITVVNRPGIQSLRLFITPPAYSGIRSWDQSDNGNVTALKGTVINYSLRANKPVKAAYLFFADSSMFPLTTEGNLIKGSYRLRGDQSYSIILKDNDGYENISPVSYTLKAMSDNFPAIELIAPKEDINLSNDQRAALFFRISDDYGFSDLTLNYRLAASRYEMPQTEFTKVPIALTKGIRETDINYIWNLSPLNLATEDVVVYYLEVFDNDNVSGPKSARTREMAVRIPSLDELFSEAEESVNQVQQELLKTLKEAEELKKELNKINDDLKQDKKEITWEEKRELEKAIEKFDDLQKKVEDIGQKLTESKQELSKNNLLKPETMEKYNEMQKLFEELSSDEMKKAMEKLQQSLQSMDRKRIQEALQNMQFDEEAFNKSLERTINLLKRVQIEQKMEELLKRSEEMLAKQEELNKQTENLNPQDKNKADELAKKQDEVSRDLEKLRQEMEKLEDKMSDLDDMPNEKMDEVQDEFDKEQSQELSEDIEKELQKQQKSSASQKQKQLKQKMQKTQKSLMSLQQQMQQQTQLQALMDMMKLLDDIIALSKQEEELKKQLEEGQQSLQKNNEAARRQENIRRNLDKTLGRMSDLSQKTFAITPEMGKALGDARRNMQQNIDALQNRNTGLAAQQSGEAMKSLNEAATLMKGNLDQMMQNGGGSEGGMMSMMQQLQRMSGQQMSLNNLTQQLQQMMGGQLTPQQQAQLERLAQQQELIRKSLDELNREAKQKGESKKLPSNLDDVLKRMEEVITDMQTDKLDDDLIQKQERILSKLLDAQRSVNERDFEKQRESKTGENVTRRSPADIDPAKLDRMNKLRDELNKAAREGYLKDYEELIRKYLEELNKRN